MKRILACGLALAALTACGGKNDAASDTAAPATTPAPSTVPAPTDSAALMPMDSAAMDSMRRADSIRTP